MLLQQQHLQQQQKLKQYQQMQQLNNSVNGSQWSTPTKRNANQTNSSTTVTSSSSNDSLVLESRTTKPLFNDDLIVIERSNRELELKLTPTKQQQQQHDQKQQQLQHFHQQQMQEQLYQQQLFNQQHQEQKYIQHQKELQQLQQQQEQLYLNHQKEQQQQQEQIYLNHQKEMQQKQEQIYQTHQKEQQQKQEQIYHQQQKEQQQQKLKNEDSPSGKVVKNRAIRFTLPSSAKNRSTVVVDTIHNNNNGFADVIYEECSDEVERIKNKISRPLSECFSASQDNLDVKSSPQSFPSIGDLPSASELSGTATFKSLTAQKLMSGLSFNSIDTLLEVNAAAEARSKHNESTETIDFGVI